MRWITESRAVAVAALLLAAAALASCATAPKALAGGAAGVAALAGKNPNGVHRSAQSSTQTNVPPAVSSRALAGGPDLPTR